MKKEQQYGIIPLTVGERSVLEYLDISDGSELLNFSMRHVAMLESVGYISRANNKYYLTADGKKRINSFNSKSNSSK